MNKKQVNDWIKPAKEAIVECGIAANGKVDSSFRGQISSFGAAVVMGSLKSAVAFFANNGSAQVERSKLIKAIYYIISNGEKKEPKDIFEFICKNDNRQTKEQFINASIAIKLALNLFDLGKGESANEIQEEGGED